LQVQRQYQDSVSADRKARLDALGFVWDVLVTQWEKSFTQLQTFVKDRGHCRVPAKYMTADGFRLGTWVNVQRQNKDSLPPDRKARLDELGFVWDPFIEQWEFAHLEAFVREHRHCRVPDWYKSHDDYRLGIWVLRQRSKRDSMHAHRKIRLDALGLVWDPLLEQWEEGLAHLEAFVREHGHCRVPQSHVAADGYQLGKWVSNQRIAARKDSMPAERKARLDALGFDWNPLANKRRISPLAAE
jgi:Helicase associated domain